MSAWAAPPPILPLEPSASSPARAARGDAAAREPCPAAVTVGWWPRRSASAKLAHRMTEIGAKALVWWAAGVTLVLALAGCVSHERTRAAARAVGSRFPACPRRTSPCTRPPPRRRSPTPTRASTRPLEADVSRIGRRSSWRRSAGAAGARSGGRLREAALLIHDLGGTPYEMRDMARAFADACYLVRAILLPGHGTVPGDLLDVDYRQWVDATRSAVASFEGEAERSSWSVSGSAARSPSTTRCPTRPVPTWSLAVWCCWRRHSGPKRRSSGCARQAFAANRVRRRRWARLLPDYDPVRYESLPRNALRFSGRVWSKRSSGSDAALVHPGVPGDQRGRRRGRCRRGARLVLPYASSDRAG